MQKRVSSEVYSDMVEIPELAKRIKEMSPEELMKRLEKLPPEIAKTIFDIFENSKDSKEN